MRDKIFIIVAVGDSLTAKYHKDKALKKFKN